MDLDIRRLDETHANDVAAVRQLSVQDGTLRQLGPTVFSRFARAAASERSTFGFVAIDHGAVVGYVINTANPRGLQKRAILGSWRAAGRTILFTLRNPHVVIAFMNLMLLPRNRSASDAAPRLRLLDIAVLPGHRGRGIGRMLIQHSLAGARERGYRAIGLTVRVDNTSAVELYRQCGFRVDAESTTRGVGYFVMSRQLD